MPNSQCDPLYDRPKKLKNGIQPTQICAGSLAGGKDTCQVNSVHNVLCDYQINLNLIF